MFFENTQCQTCERLTGFDPVTWNLLPLEKIENQSEDRYTSDQGQQFQRCSNWQQYDTCNWLIPVQKDGTTKSQLCLSCSLNKTIPDLSVAEHTDLWRTMEVSKRRCLFTLLELGLPVGSAPAGITFEDLRFQFMSDGDASSNFQENVDDQKPVLTGHLNGLITINIAEADDLARTRMRVDMHESYRTLLAHFRHETAHYYWDVFKALQPDFTARFRSIFGDESQDYSAALKRHYEMGPDPDWHNSHVSEYASAHPWEDWAETFAHYLHMLDTLETQQSFASISYTLEGNITQISLPLQYRETDLKARPQTLSTFEEIIGCWLDTTVLLNSLNRSMGLPDAYPFVLHKNIIDKLSFIHRCVLRDQHA